MEEQNKLIWLLNAISNTTITQLIEAELKAYWLVEISGKLKKLNPDISKVEEPNG